MSIGKPQKALWFNSFSIFLKLDFFYREKAKPQNSESANFFLSIFAILPFTFTPLPFCLFAFFNSGTKVLLTIAAFAAYFAIKNNAA
ncbi:hypothetical protein LF887_12640 [Chryseobacterium sp. MEBOG06]|uniref:hypothetical protein n=1 Tax=unclassified Chryseobacterium TaxID=2593645 RepID=UPI001F1F8C30|nr:MULTISPECIES: hypothetical protein [unclassified Chryseobacterium]UKB81859.1 hypothetical protein LF887_12640 [Chryseobacterium sp. MEBOG06]